MHGSPYHVYPTQNYPTQAFQNGPPGSFQGQSSINASPLLSTKSGINQHHLVIIKPNSIQPKCSVILNGNHLLSKIGSTFLNNA